MDADLPGNALRVRPARGPAPAVRDPVPAAVAAVVNCRIPHTGSRPIPLLAPAASQCRCKERTFEHLGASDNDDGEVDYGVYVPGLPGRQRFRQSSVGHREGSRSRVPLRRT